MSKIAKHGHIPALPFIHTLLGAHLDAFTSQPRGKRQDMVVDYHEFCLSAPPEILCDGERPLERVQGTYRPRRLRFVDVRCLEVEGLYTHLADLPLDHPARSLHGLMSWIYTEDRLIFSLFDNHASEPARLWITARSIVPEECGADDPAAAVPAGAGIVTITRDWSPPPPFRPGLVRRPLVLHRRFGGDPVTIRLGRRTYHRRLFVGDLDYQSSLRPAEIDAVLNIGEDPSRWAKSAPPDKRDRWVVKGEGSLGMRLAEITAEANWVIERLIQDQRVLVHCVAGLNRSVTICCAVLILLEGLSAEAALDRVRDTHAWARPDERHWLALQCLARTCRK